MTPVNLHARVAELVDALVSGTSNRKVVEVQVLSRAPNDAHWNPKQICLEFLCF